MKTKEDLDKEVSLVAFAAHKLDENSKVVGGVNYAVDLIALSKPKGGSFKCTNPSGEKLYSTAGLTATEYFNGEEWVKMEF